MLIETIRKILIISINLISAFVIIIIVVLINECNNSNDKHSASTNYLENQFSSSDIQISDSSFQDNNGNSVNSTNTIENIIEKKQKEEIEKEKAEFIELMQKINSNKLKYRDIIKMANEYFYFRFDTIDISDKELEKIYSVEQSVLDDIAYELRSKGVKAKNRLIKKKLYYEFTIVFSYFRFLDPSPTKDAYIDLIDSNVKFSALQQYREQAFRSISGSHLSIEEKNYYVKTLYKIFLIITHKIINYKLINNLEQKLKKQEEEEILEKINFKDYLKFQK